MSTSITDRGKRLLRRQPAQEDCPHENRRASVHHGMERSVCVDCRHVTFKPVGPSTTQATFQPGRIHWLMLGVEPEATAPNEEE